MQTWTYLSGYVYAHANQTPFGKHTHAKKEATHASGLINTPTCLPREDEELRPGEIYCSQAMCQPANSPSRWVRENSSQGSSKFTAKWWGNSSGTRGSILNTVIFIWRLNLAAASPPAAAHSSRIMNTVSWRLQRKHYAQLLKCSSRGRRGVGCRAPARYPCSSRSLPVRRRVRRPDRSGSSRNAGYTPASSDAKLGWVMPARRSIVT